MRNGIRQKAAQLGIVVAVAGAGLVGVIAPAGATADVTTDRASGTDRYATAAAAALGAYPNGAGTVLIASGENFPDALAGAGLAGRRAAPLLLTQRTTLPSATSQAIDTLKATNAVILGGPGAVSPAVEAQLDQQLSGDVSRVQGNDRYATAAAVAEAIGAANLGEVNGRTAAFIANGELPADALAGGPLAAAGATGQLPILLVTNRGVPAATTEVIKELGIKQVLILGGTVAVPTSVETELEQTTGNEAVRYAGSDRYGTAAAVATASLAAPFSFPGTRVLLANGERFPDALAGGPLGGVAKAPVLLTQANALPASTDSWLRTNTDKVARITALGGSVVITDATLAAAEAAAENKGGTGGSTTTTTQPGGGTNETINISPRTSESLASNGSRTFTVTGLGTTPVDIALAKCAIVKTTTDNKTGFTNANSNNVADSTDRDSTPAEDKATTLARISSINGTSTNPATVDDHADDVTPSNGQIVFQVAGPSPTASAECVRPVVYVDTNGDDGLNGSTGSTSLPTESFGVGGITNFSASSASSTTIDRANVRENNDTLNTFVACTIETETPNEAVNPDPAECKEYKYDDNDKFQFDDDADVDMDDWEEQLSAGDDVRGTYFADASGSSTFLVTDEAPTAPGGVSASHSPNGTATVVWSDGRDATHYRVYRASVPVATTSCANVTRSGATEVATPANSSSALENYQEDPPASPTGTAYCYLVSSIYANPATTADDLDDGDESTATPQSNAPVVAT